MGQKGGADKKERWGLDDGTASWDFFNFGERFCERAIPPRIDWGPRIGIDVGWRFDVEWGGTPGMARSHLRLGRWLEVVFGKAARPLRGGGGAPAP